MEDDQKKNKISAYLISHNFVWIQLDSLTTQRRLYEHQEPDIGQWTAVHSLNNQNMYFFGGHFEMSTFGNLVLGMALINNIRLVSLDYLT